MRSSFLFELLPHCLERRDLCFEVLDLFCVVALLRFSRILTRLERSELSFERLLVLLELINLVSELPLIFRALDGLIAFVFHASQLCSEIVHVALLLLQCFKLSSYAT